MPGRFLLGLGALVFSPAAWAADIPAAWLSDISTDRPTAAASAHTVGSSVFQVETGVQADIGSGTTLGLPTLLRFGLGESLELRVDSGVVSLSGGNAAVGGIGVGAKYTIARLEPVALGILAGSSIPLDEGQASPYATLLADFSSGLWANAGWAGGSSLSYAAGYGFGLSSMTPFVETAGGLDLDQGAWTGTIQAGAVWASGNLEYDLYLQTSLNGFDAHMVAAGVSYRFGVD